MKNGKRRTWTPTDVRTLKTLARQKATAGKIARKLKRTEGATRQKAFSLSVSLDARVQCSKELVIKLKGSRNGSFSFGVLNGSQPRQRFDLIGIGKTSFRQTMLRSQEKPRLYDW